MTLHKHKLFRFVVMSRRVYVYTRTYRHDVNGSFRIPKTIYMAMLRSTDFMFLSCDPPRPASTLRSRQRAEAGGFLEIFGNVWVQRFEGFSGGFRVLGF